MFGTLGVLTACGGGGSSVTVKSDPYMSTATTTSSSYVRTEVPFYTPVKVATIDPLDNVPGTGYKYAVHQTFTADIQGTGNEDVIVAGRMTQNTTVADWGNFRLSMLGFENGTLVDRTAQWFPNNTNLILGTEPSVKFADFFHSGRLDMFIAPCTDMQYYGPAHLFTNTGTKFIRTDIALSNVWAHDSAVEDMNGDGFKDIVLSDYGPNTTMLINNRINGFTAYVDSRGNTGDLFSGGSSIAAADFLKNGSTQIIVTDGLCPNNSACGSSTTKMYTWTITNNQLNYTYHSDLPQQRFSLAKWSSYGFTGSHTYRVVAFDFNEDGAKDVLVFTTPMGANNQLYHELQFLKNSGTGTFTDVTDSILVGYDTHTTAPAAPTFIDLNGDGKTDIFFSGSYQFLLKSSDGKFVAAHQNIIKDFVTQAQSAAINTSDVQNTVNILKAASGKLYLISTVNVMNGSDRQLEIYMSELGTQKTTTAQTAVNLLLQKWPYMSTVDANKALAMTSASYLGGKLIDLDTLFNPIGTLNLHTAGGLKPINGYVSGINIGTTSAVGVDGLNRSFDMNLSSMQANQLNAFDRVVAYADADRLTSQAEYLIRGPVANFGALRVGVDQAPAPGATNQQQYTIGLPDYYHLGNLAVGMQYTHLNSNPWFNFTGAWGEVTGSSIIDNVLTYQKNGFSAQGSLMYVGTSVNPGLINRVNNMWGAWGEVGYRTSNMAVYMGIRPMILSGSVNADIPTSVDNSGNIVYTNKKLAVQNQALGYVRAVYTNQLNQHSQFKLSAIGAASGEFRVINELKIQF
jgi:hypothetical protein